MIRIGEDTIQATHQEYRVVWTNDEGYEFNELFGSDESEARWVAATVGGTLYSATIYCGEDRKVDL